MLDDGVSLCYKVPTVISSRAQGEFPADRVRSCREVSVLTWASGGCAGTEPRGALGRVWGVAAVAVLVGLAVVAVRVRAAAQVIGWRRRLGP